MKITIHLGYSTAIVMDVAQAKQFMDLMQNVDFCNFKGYGVEAIYVPQPINEMKMHFIEDDQLQDNFPEEGDKE
jgi:hypothetical protein